LGIRPFVNHALVYLLSAILAWPSYVPYLSLEPDETGIAESAPSLGHSGIGIQSREKRAVLDQTILSNLGDNFEASDSQNDFLNSPPFLDQHPFEFTSLIPLPLEIGQPGSVPRPAGFPRSLHLRC
jgi:hypothetical protein